MSLAAAYHGPGWQARAGSHEDDVRDGLVWSSSRVVADFSPLRAVALHCPPAETFADQNVLHLDRIQHEALQEELHALADTYRSLGADVHWLPPKGWPTSNPSAGANAMYVRDLFWMTPAGSVLARMASYERAGEELQAQRALSDLGIPILTSVHGSGTFEGADGAWLRLGLAALGLGHRSNEAGLQQVRSEIANLSEECILIKVPARVQHLLGVLQVLDEDLIAARVDLLDERDVDQLRARGFEIVPIHEQDEVTNGMSFNFVVVGPRLVITMENATSVRDQLSRHGVACAGVIATPQLRRGAGGIACATGIVSREG